MLHEACLADSTPMIELCHKHDYMEFLTQYLVQNKQFLPLVNYINANSKNLPKVLGALLAISAEYHG